MKGKLTAFVLAAMVVAALAGCSQQAAEGEQAPEPSVDSISQASVSNYYGDSSLTGQALVDVINNRQAAITVATTNADGTPNLATVIPAFVGEDVIVFGLAENQTKVNLMERKLGVISAYIYDPAAEEKLDRNRGARLVIERISDESEIKELMEANDLAEGSILVRVVEVLPLG
jgi:hypothetical protein